MSEEYNLSIFELEEWTEEKPHHYIIARNDGCIYRRYKNELQVRVYYSENRVWKPVESFWPGVYFKMISEFDKRITLYPGPNNKDEKGEIFKKLEELETRLFALEKAEIYSEIIVPIGFEKKYKIGKAVDKIIIEEK